MKYTKVASLIAIFIAQTTLANYYRKPFSFGIKGKQLNIYSSPASYHLVLTGKRQLSQDKHMQIWGGGKGKK